MTAIAKVDSFAEIERVVVQGDLAKLTPEQRVGYYQKVCSSVGLNPFTRPFEYIMLKGKLTLYAKKDCTDQLRKINGVSIQIVSRERFDNVYVVTTRATDPIGRDDESIGAVNLENLKGDDLCNALMKAETKAKRRVTLSICGLGWLDESEIETIPNAQPVVVSDNGEILPPQNATTTAQAEEDPADLIKKIKRIESGYHKLTGKFFFIKGHDGKSIAELKSDLGTVEGNYHDELNSHIVDTYSAIQEIDPQAKQPATAGKSIRDLENMYATASASLKGLIKQ